ncbi:MAG: helix-turn-helix domain-containing protein, partial [Verrucomicrobiota bacterium]|nr:helix-turn-helix domain-containing protein [Verrucomicrobiota bacterium]
MPNAPASTNDAKAFAQRLLTLRGKLGLKQQDFAARLGVSFQTVYRWESGTVAPSPLALEKISELEAKEGESVQTSGTSELPAKRVTLDFTAPSDAVRAIVEGERLEHGHLHNPVFGT